MPPTRLLAPALLAAALLAPATAGAKELTAATVCGAAGCTTSHDGATLRALSEGGPSAPAPQSGAPFYTVRLTVEVEGASDSHWTVAWLPSARLMRARDGAGYSWLATTPAGDRAITRVARGLAPFPAGRLRGVGDDATVARADSSPPESRPAVAAADDAGGAPWLLAALLGTGAAAAAGAALWRRRRPGPALNRERGVAQP